MASLLEYKKEKSVTNLYNANKDEFSDDMTMVTETMTNGINNSLRKKKVRIFSVRGAHLIGMLADTDVAKALRRWLLEQSLDYIHSGRINEGRLIIETIERDLGKLLSPAKTGKGKVK